MNKKKKDERELIRHSTANLGYMDPDEVMPSTVVPMGKGKWTICIPTYCREKAIEELLQENMEICTEFEADVYIYDSSEDNRTQLIVKRWMEDYHNLYYIRFPAELHSNMKVYKIFQKYAWHKEYKYLWVCTDAFRWTREVFSKICAQFENDYDMIVVNWRDIEKLGDKRYYDINDFAEECGWHLTYYGGAVLNVHTMLEDVDWKRMQSKYNRPERVNHSHLCFWLEQISILKDFSAVNLSFPPGAAKRTSLYQGASSGWNEERFYVFGYCFPEAIYALPDCYKEETKSAIVKKHGKYATFGDFLGLRARGEFDISVYRALKDEWPILTDIPRRKLKKIARMSSRQVRKAQSPVQAGKLKIRKHKRQLKRFEKFSRQNKTLYIYGAGKCAIRYAGYLDEMQIEYAGFIVSDMAQNSTEINGHPVFELSGLDLSGKNIGIILGLNPDNQRQVKKLLKERGISSNIFSEYIVGI